MRLNIAAIALAMAISISSVGAGLASGSGQAIAVETNDPPSVHEVKLTSEGAASAAKAQFGGEAVGITSQNRNGQLLYDVVLLKANGLTHVWMDASGERVAKAAIAVVDDNPHVERDPKNRVTDDEEPRSDPSET